MEERLQKILSSGGIASRREAEAFIRAGRVTVNGRPAELGCKADPERGEILLDGSPLVRTDKRVYIMLNKPRGFVSTLKDERDRKTVAELVKGCGVRVYPVGRLDVNSEGLLLMTNDGTGGSSQAASGHTGAGGRPGQGKVRTGAGTGQ